MRCLRPLLICACLTPAPGRAADPGWARVDAGRFDDGAGPVALLIETPGLAPQVMLPLVDQLESAGLDVWTLRVQTWAEDPDRLVAEIIPAALRQMPPRPCILIGHGPGGTLAAMAVLALPAPQQPQALGLLGAPLVQEPRRLYSWLAARHSAGAGVDLAQLAAAPVSPEDPPVLEILLGSAPPPLSRLSPAMAERLLSWGAEGLALDLADLALPVWAGAGTADNIGPPESMRPALGPLHHFQRFGRASLLPRELDSADLLRLPQPGARLGSWAQKQLTGAGDPP